MAQTFSFGYLKKEADLNNGLDFPVSLLKVFPILQLELEMQCKKQFQMEKQILLSFNTICSNLILVLIITNLFNPTTRNKDYIKSLSWQIQAFQQLIHMLRFLTYLQITPQLKRQVKITSVICTGLFLGYFKGFIVNQQYQNINSSKLTTYQGQDQINQLIQQRKQPAVIYYYLPMNRQHAFFRQMMFKYSNLWEKEAIFTMVNLTKKFQEARGSMDLEYPTRVRLQVRHPKSQVAIKVGQEGSFFQLKEKAFRRQPFKFNYTDEGFKKFLEDNRIIEPVDPVKRVLNLTTRALFEKPQQIQTS